MSKTAFATGNALTKKAWEEKLFRDAKIEAYFDRFSGEGSGNIVQVTRKLEKDKGDTVTFGLIMKLDDSWVTSGQALEGNESSLTTYSDSVTLEEYACGVRDRGPLDRQRAMFSIDEESQANLKIKIGEKYDRLCFTAIDTSPTKIFYKTSSGVTSTATAATAKAAVTAADSKLTPSMISTIKTWAKTGGNRGYVPLRPVKVKGKEYFVLLVHPDALYDLKNDAIWTQASREAADRGDSNPLFTGAVGVWDGVVIHEHELCPIATDGGGASVAWTRGYFMGAQALVFAWGKRPSVKAEEFDYGREHGYGTSLICGVTKAQFNSLDFGCVTAYLARTNIAGL